ncbi:helix-turn-helix domain-containing protein [Fulvivirga aurantia]|uniref:helix-turn-helix domain-containing protein n=1 Tax=Fulvivirga aurantia TaxID=2529383 RepID=UPI001CA3AC88
MVKEEIESLGFRINSIDLGVAIIEESEVDLNMISHALANEGFEIIEDEEAKMIEYVKIYLRSLVNQLPLKINEKLSVQIAKEMNKDYSSISKLFSKKEHLTIEKFFQRLKLEKVKELIQEGKYTFSEIAALLDYANSNHLAKQFKDNLGMSMTDYKKTGEWNRTPLDQLN